MQRVEIAATTSPDDMFLAKLDAPVAASPLPIVASWGGQTLNDLPVCFDRLDDCVSVQEVRNAGITSQLQTKTDKVLRFCERASQPKRVAFTAPAQRWVGDATSSNSCFVIHNGKAYFVGPAAWAWGASSQPWPNVAYIDLTHYIESLKAAASKLGVALRFASFTAGGVRVDAIQQAEKPVQDYRNVILGEAAYGGLPLSYWPLQEVNGSTAVDLMATARGTGYNGTIGASVTSATTSPVVNNPVAFVFDGSTGARVDVTNPAALQVQDFSIEMWLFVNSSQSAALKAFLDYDHAGTPNHAWVIQTENATATNPNIYLAYRSGATFQPSTGIGSGQGISVTKGVWNHLVWTKSGTTVIGYRNGVSVFTPAAAASATVTYSASRNLRIAQGISGATRQAQASMAHVAVYGYALAADRIRYHYEAGINGINPVLRGIGV
jgi:hypothetical protein